MMGAWLVPIVSAGLFGSLHCVGMCGGLIAVASHDAAGTRQRISTQIAYQSGRLLSYSSLGLVAGALGHALDLAGQAAGLGKAAAILAGATMALWGLAAMLKAAGLELGMRQVGILPAAVQAWLAGVVSRPPLERAALLGGASALLPCGFLYAFALAAAATANPFGGVLVMAALWLGNLPALLGFGLALGGLLAPVRRHIPLLSAAAIFALGVLTLNGRVNLPAFAASMATGAHAPSSEPSAMPADCPYHRKRQP